MKRKISTLTILLLLTAFASAQNNKINRSIVGSSAVENASSSFQMKGTLGQAAVGVSTNNETTIASGYWGWISKQTNLSTEKKELIPSVFKIQPAYPNPFNPSTKIEYTIPEKSNVNLKVFNIAGQEIKSLVTGIYNSGNYTVSFTGNNLPTGAYIYRIVAKG